MVRHSAQVAALLFVMIGTAGASSQVTEVVNALSLQEGTLPVVAPAFYGSWVAEHLLDESSASGWASESGLINNNVFVFELVAESTFERFEFDAASVDAEGAGARDVVVEVSADSPDVGFVTVLEASLAAGEDGQVFSVSEATPARWVRLTIRNNHGNKEWTELFSFRGFGPQPVSGSLEDISGTYMTDYSDFHVRQQGTALIGCYEHDEGLLEGTIEGRVMKITWKESGGPDDHGPAVMVFAPDGKSFKGYWWYGGSEGGSPNGTWDGQKRRDTVDGCPHWTGSLEGELKRKLETEKRATVYGILFDVDSAVIRPESEAILTEVLAVLVDESDWRLTIEGHTDDTGSEQHNQALSQQRAASVKAYLVAHGIDEGRLKTLGFGESQPVADNATELGRAQNRRVELVRN